MRRIEVDDQVYARLEGNGQGFEQPNDVLRRLLGLDDGKSVPTTAPPAPSDYISSKLKLLINDGLIAPGDTLIHQQGGGGDTFHAVVEADGWITTDIKRYLDRRLHSRPSSAHPSTAGPTGSTSSRARRSGNCEMRGTKASELTSPRRSPITRSASTVVRTGASTMSEKHR